MNIKTNDADKQEVIRRLSLVKTIIGKLIDQIENGLNWELTHPQFIVAMTQLKYVNRQLTIHHIEVCIANRLKKQQSIDASQRIISEFIKTFNYIN